MAGELEGAQKALRELSKSLKKLSKNPRPNDIHKLRTSSRRAEALAVVLPEDDQKQSRQFLKAIEPVRKAAGNVRDMDVLAAHAHALVRRSAGESLNRLIDHLEKARDQNADALVHALDGRRKAVREKLKKYSKRMELALRGAGSRNGRAGEPQQNIQAAARRVACELGSWAPLGVENIHEFRVKVKGLRYILQLDEDADAAIVEALGTVQRHIGDWHDWQQLEEIAREVLNAERDGALLERIGETAKRKLAQALKSANGLRAKYLAMPIAQGI